MSSPPLQAAGGTLKRSSSKASLTEPKPKRQRTKAGCITCRVRGKKCDEQKVDNGESCETCKRLRLHCLGFQDRRPDWLRTKENIKIWRKRVTEFLMSQGLVKGHAGCGLRPGSTPDASLTLEDMRRDLDAWGSAPGPDSPSGPLQDHERDLEPEPLGFVTNMHGHRDYTLPPLQNIARPPYANEGEDTQYLPKRFENAIGGIADEDSKEYRWVPPPPFSPMKRPYEEDAKYPNIGQFPPRAAMNGPPGYGTHPPLASPTNNRFDARDMRPPGPMHSSSGSFSSMPDTNSDPFNGSPTNGAPANVSYNGSNSRAAAPVYNQPLPTMSPGHHAPYSHPKGAPGYPQQTQAPVGYGIVSEHPGQSSGTSSP